MPLATPISPAIRYNSSLFPQSFFWLSGGTVWTDPSLVNGVLTIALAGRTSAPVVGLESAPAGAAVRWFCAGPENLLAATAAERCLEPGAPSPLVLYGLPGCGKSLLARGLAAEWSRRRPEAATRVLSASEFAGEFADAIEARAIEAWRAGCRQVDLLVLEDLGQISNKPAVQVELLNAIDELAARGAQVIVTSRLPPSETPGMTPALVSRLSAGLSVPLAPPGPEARREILQHVAAERRMALAPAAARLLADGLVVTAPELTGALLQLESQWRPSAAARSAVQIDAPLARQYLAQRGAARQPSLRGIAIRTARHFALQMTELKSASRRRGVVQARDVAMYLARQLTRKTLEEIGEFFGGRDHTTVLHGCRKTERLLQSDPSTRSAVAELRQSLVAM